MNTYGERLWAALDARRPNDKNARQWLADQIDISVQAIGQVLTGKTKALTAENHEKAVAALGCSGMWLATGEGVMQVPQLSRGDEGTHVVAAEDAVRVPLLANAGSMGAGNDQLHDDVVVGALTLSQAWLAQRIRPTSMRALRFIHGYGDSMSPTYEDGDILLVDTGAIDHRSIDGVYVLSANDRVYIKRVRHRLDGHVEVSSDNPTVKTVDVLNGDNQVKVLGRVIWAWNGKKL